MMYKLVLLLLILLTGSVALAQSSDFEKSDSSLVDLVKSKDRSLENIQRIQESLKNLDFDPGPIDGLMGKKTRSALMEWNKTQTPPLSLKWTNYHKFNKVKIGKDRKVNVGPGTSDCPGGFRVTVYGLLCNK